MLLYRPHCQLPVDKQTEKQLRGPVSDALNGICFAFLACRINCELPMVYLLRLRWPTLICFLFSVAPTITRIRLCIEYDKSLSPLSSHLNDQRKYQVMKLIPLNSLKNEKVLKPEQVHHDLVSKLI
ncbi:uncharacterized protein WM277_027907 [Molossus nigricans]